MAHAKPDDDFREIQLSGKQLVFLFMAATVFSVVVFLCGVLVGRGVRAERASAEASTVNDGPADFAPPQTVSAAPAAAQVPDPTVAPPPVPPEDLSYFKPLDQANQAAGNAKPAAAKSAKASEPPTANAQLSASSGAASATTPSAATAAAAPPPALKQSASPAAATAADAAPAAGGFAVQIAALNVRSEADAIAKRLSSKGYAAYVLPSTSGTPAVYRVRVGTFKTRHEADTVAAKLQKEEQLKPWVTR